MALKYTLLTLEDYSKTHEGRVIWPREVFNDILQMTDGHDLETNSSVVEGDNLLHFHYYTSIIAGAKDLGYLSEETLYTFSQIFSLMTDEDLEHWLWERAGCKVKKTKDGYILWEYAEIPYTVFIYLNHCRRYNNVKLGTWHIQKAVDYIEHIGESLDVNRFKMWGIICDRKLRPMYKLKWDGDRFRAKPVSWFYKLWTKWTRKFKHNAKHLNYVYKV